MTLEVTLTSPSFKVMNVHSSSHMSGWHYLIILIQLLKSVHFQSKATSTNDQSPNHRIMRVN